MKITKVQTLGAILLKCVAKFELKTPLHALGEHAGVKTELYQTNVKSHAFISFQHKLLVHCCIFSKKHTRLIMNANNTNMYFSKLLKLLGSGL